MKTSFVAIAICALLAGCAGEKRTPDPIGIGTGTYELKQSPCACVEVPMKVPAVTQG